MPPRPTLPTEPPQPVITPVKPFVPDTVKPPESKTEFKRGFIPQEVIDAAIASEAKWKVPAAVTIAQFILESNWGLKNLGVNNFFGIKDLSWHPGNVIRRTKEYIHGQWVTVDCAFEDFESIGDCFDVHGRLLAKSKYYAEAMKHIDDANEFAENLTGIYATDPNYGKKLRSFMIKYNLYKYKA